MLDNFALVHELNKMEQSFFDNFQHFLENEAPSATDLEYQQARAVLDQGLRYSRVQRANIDWS